MRWWATIAGTFDPLLSILLVHPHDYLCFINEKKSTIGNPHHPFKIGRCVWASNVCCGKAPSWYTSLSGAKHVGSRVDRTYLRKEISSDSWSKSQRLSFEFSKFNIFTKKISGKPIKTVFTKHMRRFLYIHYVYRYTITQITWGTLLNLMHIHIWKTLLVAIVMAPRSTIQERAVTPIYANTCIFVQVFSINITNLGR